MTASPQLQPEQVAHNATVDEYLALVAQSAGKHEYVNGHILAMSGGTPAHSLIAGNALFCINETLFEKRPECSAFTSDARVHVESSKAYFYPDISMVGGPIETAAEDALSIVNPLLIVEVLSPSTEGYDRGDKFHAYMQIPSFREYLIIDSRRPAVDVYYRKEKGRSWFMDTSLGLEASVYVHTLEAALPLQRLYRNVPDLGPVFPPPPEEKGKPVDKI